MHGFSLKRELKSYISSEVLRHYNDQFLDPEFMRWYQHFWAEGYEMRNRTELIPRIRETSCPVAIIWGKNDEHLSPEIAQELALMFQNAKLTLLDCGHFPMEQQFDATFAALSNLLMR